jgi:ribonuclease HIII
MGQMKQEQTFTRQKLQEVETSVATSGQAIIQQMQSMFSSMQSSLEKTMQQNMNGDPDKRQRVDETGNGRADPFATKS